jgi:hypothetical protein
MSAAFLSIEHFHAVDAETCKQTIEESKIEYSTDMGRGVIIHHGMRYGSPVVIAEYENQKADELSGIWFNENDGSAS